MIELFPSEDSSSNSLVRSSGVREQIHIPRGMNRLQYGVLKVGTKEWDWHSVLMSDDQELIDFTKRSHPDWNIAYNARTAAGASWQASLMGSAAGTPASYMAITTDSTTVANTDTTLTSELATNGLSRSAATYAYLTAQSTIGGTAVYTQQGTWTYTGSTPTTIAKAALFNASSAGTMAWSAVLSSTMPVSANGDIAKVLWSVTI